jgi:peptidyl-prolyl cis-trans isomerase D
MLKILRKGAVENPWIYRTIMFLIAGAFVISMGWWGFSDEGDPYVAQIDQARITRAQYIRRAASVVKTGPEDGAFGRAGRTSRFHHPGFHLS